MDLAHEIQLEIIKRQVYEIDSIDHLRAVIIQMIGLLDRQKELFKQLARQEFGEGVEIIYEEG